MTQALPVLMNRLWRTARMTTRSGTDGEQIIKPVNRTRSKKCIPAFRRGNAGLFQGPFVSGQMWVRLAVHQEQSAAVPARVGGSWGQAVPRAPGRAEHSPHCQGCSSPGDRDVSPAQRAGAAVGTRMGLSGDANRREAV